MPPKTYKREFAAALVVPVMALAVASIWAPPALEAAKAMAPYVFTFAGLAFGMDAYAKQVVR